MGKQRGLNKSQKKGKRTDRSTMDDTCGDDGEQEEEADRAPTVATLDTYLD